MALVSSRLLFLLSAILILIQASALPAPLLPPTCNNNNGNYTSNSTYEKNLNQVLYSLYSNTTIDYGFYYSSYGQNSDQVYAIGLCGGDVNPDDCRGCLTNCSTLLTQLCPNQKEAIWWYSQCMLRYSNRSIFGIMNSTIQVDLCNNENVSANYVDQYNDDVHILLNNLTSEAAAGGSLRNLSTILCWEAPAPSSTNTTTSPPLTNTTTTAEGNPRNTLWMVIIIVASVAFVVLIVSICICVYLRVSSPREKAAENIDEEIPSVESLQFDFSTISAATDDFSEANKLGQGGFGAVYKGTLYNGQDVAVKRLSTNSGQGDLEFKNEVLLVAKLQHRNLVRLLGFCMERNERLLIYEFVPNTSLDHFLFGNPFNYILQAWKNWREGTASHIIDPTLRHSPTIEIMRCIHIGLLCVQENVTDRPTMALIVLMLNSYSITLPVPSHPAFFMHSNIESDKSSNWGHNLEVARSDHSKGHYVQHSENEASVTELYPR
nr:cysteine-rich receptor-like protein kinase 41 [Quercus suber]